jgi:hypothetical protein
LLSLARQRFYVNMARVDALTEPASISRRDETGDDGERRATLVADLLRAVTVFLHAAFEDWLRSLQGKNPG